MPKIKYADMHCDSVTACCKRGESMPSFSGQINLEKLNASGCAAQCFALFTEGENAAENFEKFLAFYNAQIPLDPRILPVERAFDLEKAIESGRTAAILTVENLGFTDGDLSKIALLKNAGVKMASLVWNNANCYAFSNLVIKDGLPEFRAAEERGLTEKGRAAVAELNANGIIIDISHLSDGGAEDVLNLSSAPVVASHSNCRAVCNVSRNLTDGQLKRIAVKGGVAGLNFCRAFVIDGAADDELHGTDLCKDESAFEWLYRHYVHMVKIGGEDLPALGGDMDGITPYGELKDCTRVPDLLEYFERRGVSAAALEKFAYKNFLRVFKDVCG